MPAPARSRRRALAQTEAAQTAHQTYCIGLGTRQTAGVRKKRGIILAAVLAVLGGLLWLLFFSGPPEPVYQGKRLSAWLEGYAGQIGTVRDVTTEEADNAVRHIGTNAIPTLLRRLRARDSALTHLLHDLAMSQSFVRIRYFPAVNRHEQAVMAFKVLGAEARDAVPELTRIFEENISLDSRFSTAEALGAISPDAKVALPALVKVAADTNAADEVARLVRLCVIETLGQIQAEPELVVPALTKALNDPDSRFRKEAAAPLGRFGPVAKPAVPVLFKILEHQDWTTRHAAAAAIKQIDPEAAALRKTELDAATAWPY